MPEPAESFVERHRTLTHYTPPWQIPPHRTRGDPEVVGQRPWPCVQGTLELCHGWFHCMAPGEFRFQELYVQCCGFVGNFLVLKRYVLKYLRWSIKMLQLICRWFRVYIYIYIYYIHNIYVEVREGLSKSVPCGNLRKQCSKTGNHRSKALNQGALARQLGWWS